MDLSQYPYRGSVAGQEGIAAAPGAVPPQSSCCQHVISVRYFTFHPFRITGRGKIGPSVSRLSLYTRRQLNGSGHCLKECDYHLVLKGVNYTPDTATVVGCLSRQTIPLEQKQKARFFKRRDSSSLYRRPPNTGSPCHYHT